MRLYLMFVTAVCVLFLIKVNKTKQNNKRQESDPCFIFTDNFRHYGETCSVTLFVCVVIGVIFCPVILWFAVKLNVTEFLSLPNDR